MFFMGLFVFAPKILNLSDVSFIWMQRLKIWVGVARGLNYVHRPMGTKQRVLLRDIKSSNILLDDERNAQIGPTNQSHTYLVSNVVGTFGYCDPSYFETGLLEWCCLRHRFVMVENVIKESC
ncbi:Protein kinase, catalytic domain-containing protein, partial [Cynara cardunculus var. scolymus]